ncbi:tyrosine-type recombinase/integrase [Sphingobacterium sp. DK4209]|uniref:Tyrosine-type recombinase/integrase n=1 Tax=Sphingobacterium zhuxiongii TaxID=2662364 RepID=A0A5Q0QCB4_9SPHI|nr:MULTISPECIES: site-specific integrase [unclassified Sphingobacterium]MVZ67443.1 tyrosine-type recombinase/integrase [Sphingobacterium sp. DK4209]QGA24860.1 tyrosine-type recombinase/integrase [Sphingobacterium sp. dk4302]
MSTNYSLLFYLKKPKNYVNGAKPIYMRITIDGSVCEISTGKSCDPSRWNSKANRSKGNTEEVKTLNSYLEMLNLKVAALHLEILKLGEIPTIELLKLKITGKAENQKTLLSVLRDHNLKMDSLLGNGFRENTLKGYRTTHSHLESYIAKEFSASDVELHKIDHSFIVGYEYYLRTEKACSDISAAKYMKHLRKIINLSLAHEWITSNPFKFYKTNAKPKEKSYLNRDELTRIVNKKLEILRLQHVRDIFVFCCYTGLSYADVSKLTKRNIEVGIDNRFWIKINRQKTNTLSSIPILPKALEILKLYRDYPPSKSNGQLLPILSNQKMNSYLKEIADLCGITKELTFHIARHTFATTVTLSNGVPIETVSKMLGHLDIRTTQHYAKLLDNRISKDMEELVTKLGIDF